MLDRNTAAAFNAEIRRAITLTRIRECQNHYLLNRASSLFLAWGNRRLADVAHTRRGALLEQMFRK